MDGNRASGLWSSVLSASAFMSRTTEAASFLVVIFAGDGGWMDARVGWGELPASCRAVPL